MRCGKEKTSTGYPYPAGPHLVSYDPPGVLPDPPAPRTRLLCCPVPPGSPLAGTAPPAGARSIRPPLPERNNACYTCDIGSFRQPGREEVSSLAVIVPRHDVAFFPRLPLQRKAAAMATGAAAGGFSFDLCRRNEMLRSRGVEGPGFTKTGTTIAGVIYKVSWPCAAAPAALSVSDLPPVNYPPPRPPSSLAHLLS